MSKFAIYRSKGFSLQKIAIINLTFNLFYALLLPLIGFAGILSNKLHINDTVILGSLILWIVVIIILNLLARKINKQLEQFGELQITNSGITKTIAGITEKFDFDTIKEIELKRHIRTFFFPSNASGIKTYLAAIITKNSSMERFVVSSQSIDIPVVDFFKSLYKVRKFTGNKLKIKNKANRML